MSGIEWWQRARDAAYWVSGEGALETAQAVVISRCTHYSISQAEIRAEKSCARGGKRWEDNSDSVFVLTAPMAFGFLLLASLFLTALFFILQARVWVWTVRQHAQV